MYCKNCGKEIDDKAEICIYCGCGTGQKQTTKNETNVLAIVGFIFSFFFAVVGLICSILGYRKAAELGGSGKGLSIAGIIISAVWLGIVMIALISM